MCLKDHFQRRLGNTTGEIDFYIGPLANLCFKILDKKQVVCFKNAQFPSTWIHFCDVGTRKIYEAANSNIQVLTVKYEANANREWYVADHLAAIHNECPAMAQQELKQDLLNALLKVKRIMSYFDVP